MPEYTRRRELGRGERVLPGVWRLRLPLAQLGPGVPHCNAWALSAGDGVVLIDCGRRVSLYFDHGWTPDPVGEFLRSLDSVQALDARLCLATSRRTSRPTARSPAGVAAAEQGPCRNTLRGFGVEPTGRRTIP